MSDSKHNESEAQSVTDVIRLTDVAREAGVAIATASRALSNPTRVNAKTRARVVDAARRLGYTTNIAARSLRSGLSRVVLVMMPPWTGFNVLDSVLGGVDAELNRAGYSMIVGSLDTDGSESRIMELARGGFVDGILAITNEPPETGGLPILSARLPAAGLLIDLSPFGVPSVVVTERDGLRMLTEHLITRGRRRLMFVGGKPGYHNVERMAGFHDAIRDAAEPISTVHITGNYTVASGIQAARAFLSMPERPDGVVLTSDWMALAFIDAVRAAGVRVPEDVSVTGFDDIDAARFGQPPLTTYRQPMDKMGAAAAKMLLRLIAGEPLEATRRTVFEGDLVIRDSS